VEACEIQLALQASGRIVRLAAGASAPHSRIIPETATRRVGRICASRTISIRLQAIKRRRGRLRIRSTGPPARSRLHHPVIDTDAHIIEGRFVLDDFQRVVACKWWSGSTASALVRRPGAPRRYPARVPAPIPSTRPLHAAPPVRVASEEAGVDFSTLPHHRLSCRSSRTRAAPQPAAH
jgi:hypothetical protein